MELCTDMFTEIMGDKEFECETSPVIGLDDMDKVPKNHLQDKLADRECFVRYTRAIFRNFIKRHSNLLNFDVLFLNRGAIEININTAHETGLISYNKTFIRLLENGKIAGNVVIPMELFDILITSAQSKMSYSALLCLMRLYVSRQMHELLMFSNFIFNNNDIIVDFFKEYELTIPETPEERFEALRQATTSNTLVPLRDFIFNHYGENTRKRLEQLDEILDAVDDYEYELSDKIHEYGGDCIDDKFTKAEETA